MKSVSGKESAKALERHGWKLLRVHGAFMAATTFIEKQKALFGSLSRFTGTKFLSWDC
jgi:hypothetical protein